MINGESSAGNGLCNDHFSFLLPLSQHGWKAVIRHWEHLPFWLDQIYILQNGTLSNKPTLNPAKSRRITFNHVNPLTRHLVSPVFIKHLQNMTTGPSTRHLDGKVLQGFQHLHAKTAPFEHRKEDPFTSKGVQNTRKRSMVMSLLGARLAKRPKPDFWWFPGFGLTRGHLAPKCLRFACHVYARRLIKITSLGGHSLPPPPGSPGRHVAGHIPAPGWVLTSGNSQAVNHIGLLKWWFSEIRGYPP